MYKRWLQVAKGTGASTVACLMILQQRKHVMGIALEDYGVAIAVILKNISVGCLKIRAGIIERHNFYYPRKRNYNNEEATQKEEA